MKTKVKGHKRLLNNWVIDGKDRWWNRASEDDAILMVLYLNNNDFKGYEVIYSDEYKGERGYSVLKRTKTKTEALIYAKNWMKKHSTIKLGSIVPEFGQEEMNLK